MINRFSSLTSLQKHEMYVLKRRSGHSTRSPRELVNAKVGMEKFGHYTICLLRHRNRYFTGVSKLSTKDIKAAERGWYKIDDAIGQKLAFNNAARNALNLPPRNSRDTACLHPRKA